MNYIAFADEKDKENILFWEVLSTFSDEVLSAFSPGQSCTT